MVVFIPYSLLQILAESEEAQICVLRNVWELWQRHAQMVCVLVDKMLKTQIVECSAVATWLFSKEMASYFTHSYLWEVLHLTIDKMNKHVSKLSESLNNNLKYFQNFFHTMMRLLQDYNSGSWVRS